MDRRTRKKRETRAKIVVAATGLFERQGYSLTTMEEVAERADVGVGTLYNYFRSKDRLLLGVFQDATEEVLAEGRAVLDGPGDDPEGAICRLLATYAPLATVFEKPVLREMFAAAMVRPTEEVEEFASLDLRLAASLGELVLTLKGRGVLSRDVDVEAASLVLYSALMVPVLLFLSVEAMDAAALDAMVRGQVHLVLSGLLPRAAGGEKRGAVKPGRKAREKKP